MREVDNLSVIAHEFNQMQAAYAPSLASSWKYIMHTVSNFDRLLQPLEDAIRYVFTCLDWKTKFQ